MYFMFVFIGTVFTRINWTKFNTGEVTKIKCSIKTIRPQRSMFFWKPSTEEDILKIKQCLPLLLFLFIRKHLRWPTFVNLDIYHYVCQYRNAITIAMAEIDREIRYLPPLSIADRSTTATRWKLGPYNPQISQHIVFIWNLSPNLGLYLFF